MKETQSTQHSMAIQRHGDTGRSSRGQTFTLQSILGALILLSAIMFAIQATGVTPSNSGTLNAQVTLQNKMLAEDALDIGAQDGSLSKTVRYYDTSKDKFVGASGNRWYTNEPPTKFGELVGKALQEDTVFNIYVRHQLPSGEETTTTRLVYQGTPSGSSASAVRTLFLYDYMKITDPNNDKTIKQDGNFYIDDVSSGPLYNIVQVKIVVWEV